MDKQGISRFMFAGPLFLLFVYEEPTPEVRHTFRNTRYTMYYVAYIKNFNKIAAAHKIDAKSILKLIL